MTDYTLINEINKRSHIRYVPAPRTDVMAWLVRVIRRALGV